MAWDDLERWGDVKIIKRFDQGIVNDVRLVELNGSTVVARQGRRSATSLQWEADLLAYLDSNGLSVPNFIPTTDGVTHTNGLVVMRYVEGRMPESDKDWQLVVDYLTQLHALTGNFAQRPGFASSSELADADMTICARRPESIKHPHLPRRHRHFDRLGRSTHRHLGPRFWWSRLGRRPRQEMVERSRASRILGMGRGCLLGPRTRTCAEAHQSTRRRRRSIDPDASLTSTELPYAAQQCSQCSLRPTV